MIIRALPVVARLERAPEHAAVSLCRIGWWRAPRPQPWPVASTVAALPLARTADTRPCAIQCGQPALLPPERRCADRRPRSCATGPVPFGRRHAGWDWRRAMAKMRARNAALMKSARAPITLAATAPPRDRLPSRNATSPTTPGTRRATIALGDDDTLTNGMMTIRALPVVARLDRAPVHAAESPCRTGLWRVPRPRPWPVASTVAALPLARTTDT